MMDLGITMTTPADTIYQKDIQGGRLPREFPPEPTLLDGKKLSADGQTGQNVDFSV